MIACSRSGSESANITTHKNLRRVMLGNISATTDWSEHLSNIDCVVHCIGASTVKPFSNLAPLDEFNYVNRDITLNLAKQAKMAGVAKFIYLSTIKVNGEKSDTAIPLKPQDHPNPESHYGISKWNAEQAIRKLALPSTFDVFIIRAPMVYSRSGKGNIEKLLSLIKTGLPLPEMTDKNKRSIIALDNLTDFITCCVKSNVKINETLFVSDDRDFSTKELVEMLYKSCGKSPRYIPFSEAIFHGSLKVLRQRDLSIKLFGSLRMDIEQSKKLLNWSPSFLTEKAFQEYYSGDKFEI